MPFGGEYSARTPGEARVFSFDFFNDLSAGDVIVSAETTLAVRKGADPNASTLLIGSPTILAGLGPASVVAQMIGSNPANPAGFVADTVYLWTINAQTRNGETLMWDEWIPILDVI